MTIQINADGINIPVRHIEFSDGGSNLEIEWPEGFKPTQNLNVSVHPSTPVDKVLFEIRMVGDYIRYWLKDSPFWEMTRGIKLGLDLPYLPHGRADRRFSSKNATPLHSFLSAIEGLFDVIYLTDPHSATTEKFFKVEGGCIVTVKTQADCFAEMRINVTHSTVIVAPDEGARDKAAQIGGLFCAPHESGKVPVVQASKVRDPSNGRILSTKVDCGDLHGIDCIIVDDICDGGGTFIPLAEALLAKGARNVQLYVTHGIFAKGLEPFKGLISKLHVYQIVSNYVTRADIDAFNSTIFTKG